LSTQHRGLDKAVRLEPEHSRGGDVLLGIVDIEGPRRFEPEALDG
jgi:hypothetical protein